MTQQHYGIASNQVLLFGAVDFFLKMCFVRNRLTHICILLAHISGVSIYHTAYERTSKFSRDAIFFRQESSCSSLFLLNMGRRKHSDVPQCPYFQVARLNW
jgi:hypothetical protein